MCSLKLVISSSSNKLPRVLVTGHDHMNAVDELHIFFLDSCHAWIAARWDTVCID